jgi:hypothetical protein
VRRDHDEFRPIFFGDAQEDVARNATPRDERRPNRRPTRAVIGPTALSLSMSEASCVASAVTVTISRRALK